ncbi:MAG: hypothetical protein ACREM2_01330 [Vulcanimicrobiaceae bacterium]
MRVVRIACCGLAGAALAIACALSGSASARSRLAPADEYFGPYHESPLEITNRVHDNELHGARLGDLEYAQAGLVDWSRKYPRDPWVSDRERRLEKQFLRIRTHRAYADAHRCHLILVGLEGGRPAPTRVALHAKPKAKHAAVHAKASSHGSAAPRTHKHGLFGFL